MKSNKAILKSLLTGRVVNESLAARIMVVVGFATTAVVIASTVTTYVNVRENIKDQVLDDLREKNKERVARESILFQDVQKSMYGAKAEFERRFTYRYDTVAVMHRLEALAVRDSDSVIRNRRGFDNSLNAGIFIDKNTHVSHEFAHNILTQYDICEQYGPAYTKVKLQDLFFSTPKNSMIVYWDGVNWCQNAKANFNIAKEEYVANATKESNPERKFSWTAPYFESVSNKWLVTGSLPIDFQGKHIATVGQDVELSDIIKRVFETASDAQISNMIMNEDGKLISHPYLRELLLKYNGKYNIYTEKNDSLIKTHELAKLSEKRGEVMFNDISNQYVVANKLAGTPWYYITVYEGKFINEQVFAMTSHVLVYGFIALLVQLVILYFLFKKNVIKPLEILTYATEKIMAGDFNYKTPVDREDELGKLSEAFNKMTTEINDREQELSAQYEELLQSEEEYRQISDELKISLDHLKDSQGLILQQEKMASLGQLVAGIAHEINTPIGISVTAASHLGVATEQFLADVKNPLSNKAQTLSQYIKDADESTKVILKNLDRAAELIQSFKKVAVNQTIEDAISFDLKVFMEDVLISMNPTLKKAHITYRIEIIDGIKLYTYAGALSQVIMNFISNATRYAFDDKTGGLITIEASQNKDQVIIHFTDNGKGISKENIVKIFDPFFTTGRNIGGSGLGLNIVYNIVTQKLGGSIEVESQVGKGTTFIVTIPVKVTETAEVLEMQLISN